MLRFDIITIFPEIFDCYFSESIIRRAQKKRLIKIAVQNLRDYTSDKHRTVDDKPYGGGAGMILKVEPIYRCISQIAKPLSRARACGRKLFKKSGRLAISDKRLAVVLFSAKGRQFDQRVAEQFAKLERLILICGRYEGVDERVAKHIADMEVSVGPYVLTGGEIPAMAVVDAVTRLIPGVIKEESLREESFSTAISHKPYAISHKNRPTAYGLQHKAVGEYPQYTRPEVFYPSHSDRKIAWRVPKILLTGDHKKIAEWRAKHIR